MNTTGKVTSIISNLVVVQVDGSVGQNEICMIEVGNTRLMAEVIKIVGDKAYTQVFESTRGLKVGNHVEFQGHMLELTLGPGLLSRNFDGLQNDLERMDSDVGRPGAEHRYFLPAVPGRRVRRISR